MKNNIIIITLAFSIAISSNNINADYYTDTNYNSIIKTGLGVIGIGSCLVGVGTLIHWLFSETNEQLLQKTEQSYDLIFHTYIEKIQFLANNLNIGSNLSFDNNRIINSLNEKQLIKLYNRLKPNIQNYQYNCSRDINTLESNYKKITNALYTLKSKEKNYNSIWLIDRMEAVSIKIMQLLPELELFQKVLETHINFFSLYQITKELKIKYKEELQFINCSSEIIKSKLQSFIFQLNHTHYPYLTYVEKLEHYLYQLETKLNNTQNYYYFNVHSFARELINYLKALKSMTTLEQNYHKELFAKKQERLEQEKIKLLQQQVNIEKEKLWQLQKQNELQHEKLMLKEIEYIDQKTSPSIMYKKIGR